MLKSPVNTGFFFIAIDFLFYKCYNESIKISSFLSSLRYKKAKIFDFAVSQGYIFTKNPNRQGGTK